LVRMTQHLSLLKFCSKSGQIRVHILAQMGYFCSY
jgi:hypothetical protein